MIVDTSALIAILLREPAHEAMRIAIETESAILPAPAMIEFMTVASGARIAVPGQARDLLHEWRAIGMEIVALTSVHAEIASDAIATYGKGMGGPGQLNLVDLMVYAVARERDAPLLFTGRDFAETDVGIHPASRTDR